MLQKNTHTNVGLSERVNLYTPEPGNISQTTSFFLEFTLSSVLTSGAFHCTSCQIYIPYDDF